MILIIEDEPLLSELLYETLRGLNRLCIGSYNELIELPSQTISNTYMVISDLHLEQNHSAINVKDYVLNINPNIQCVLMSGGNVPPEISSLFKCTLLKPFNLKEFRKMCSTRT